MDNRKVLELAIETLERQKAEIDRQIIELRTQAGGGTRGASSKPTAAKRRRVGKPAKKVAAKKGPRTAAARKAQSERMKAYWAKKKAQKK